MIFGIRFRKEAEVPSANSKVSRLLVNLMLEQTLFSFLDLCCGAGGFSSGFKEAHWSPLLGVDVCKESLRTYTSNIGAPTLNCDITGRYVVRKIEESLGDSIPFAVIAGPPCQGFSRVGPLDPLDSRNSVLGRTVKVATSLNPKVIVVENVANILRMPFKSHLDRAISILKRAGYVADYRLINAKQFGVPQKRERMILLARRRGSMSLTIARERVRAYFRQIELLQSTPLDLKTTFEGLPLVGTVDGLDSMFKNHVAMRHSKRVRDKIARISPGSGPLSYRKLDPDGLALTLICGHRAFPVHYAENRAITVREAARIQSFKDDFEFFGSRSNQMTQVANAVPPKLGEVIAMAIRAVELT